MRLKSSNPFLGGKSFAESNTTVYNTDGSVVTDYNSTMTVAGAMNKAFLLFLLLLGGAVVTWTMAFNGANPLPFAIGGAILGFIAVLVSSFKPSYSPVLAPAYAVLEGLFIGGISAIFEAYYPGLVIEAVAGTFVTFGVCLALYRFGVVKVTDQFRSVVIAATFAIATYYLISWLFSMFGGYQPVHYGSSMMSIGISVFVIIIAALNLFLDFDLIEKGAANRLPKYMEWYGGMGLIITLVWLYIEFLRLLSKLRD